jgi:membrane-associated phospholipid phosphatase
MKTVNMKAIKAVVMAYTLLALTGTLARADEVANWNNIMLQAGHTDVTSPVVMSRVAAIVAGAVYDAVNGIDQRFTPLHVAPAAAPGASRPAAAVLAAYGTLLNLYPDQKPLFDTQLASSLASIAQSENPVAIARGIAWGQTVAAQILAWRSTDGFTPPPPPFLGGLAPGEWRPTPPAFAPGADPQFAYMTPWVIQSPSQFQPAGPPDLTSARYTSVFNEVKSMGSATSTTRTADETLYATFWASSTPAYFFDTTALSLAAQHHPTLLEEARLLALLNVAMADAAIGAWEGKYYYVFWRPITGITLADTDGNPETEPDPAWMPLLVTPPFPEYPAAHPTLSSAAATVLAKQFGGHTSFNVISDSTFLPAEGVVRSFTNFPAAVTEVSNARVFGGIHFRSATDAGESLGAAVGTYVINNAFQTR